MSYHPKGSHSKIGQTLSSYQTLTYFASGLVWFVLAWLGWVWLCLVVFDSVWLGLVANICGCCHWKPHILIACLIISQFDVIYGHICLIDAEIVRA